MDPASILTNGVPTFAVEGTIIVTAGAAERRFLLRLVAEAPATAEPGPDPEPGPAPEPDPEPVVAPPTILAPLADVVLDQGEGLATVSTQAGFAGEDLVFALEDAAAPAAAGVTIHPVSGIVTIPLAVPLAPVPVMVAATNAGGTARQSFTLSVVAAAAIPLPVPPAPRAGDWTLEAGMVEA